MSRNYLNEDDMKAVANAFDEHWVTSPGRPHYKVKDAPPLRKL